MQKQSRQLNRLPSAFRALSSGTIFGIGLAITAIWFVYFAISTILIPYPLEYREGAAQVLTQLLQNGENPYAIANQPLAMNNYGILYNLVTYPFVIFFGNTLAVYRSVNFIFLLLIFWIISQTAYKNGSRRAIALAIGLMIVITISSRSGIGAFPAIMGTGLFLSAVLIPFRFSFHRKSLWMSAFLAVLAYYTKPYFVLSFAIVASYIFLFVSKKKGLLYGIVFSAIFATFFIPVRLSFDFYFIDTFWGNIANANKSFNHMYMQLAELAKEFFPTVILAGWIAFGAFRSTQQTVFSKITSFKVDLRDLDQPVLSQPVNYFAFWGLCSTLAFILILGGHRGAYMAYAYQLILSPLLLWLSQSIDLQIHSDKIVMPLILLNMIVLSCTFLQPGFLAQRNSPEWTKLYGYVADSTNILNSPAIVSALLEHGRLPVDSGQTEHYYLIDQPYPQIKLLGPGYSAFKARGKEYKRSISQLVSDRYYDRLLLTEGEWLENTVYAEMLKNYALVDKIAVPMPQVDQNWMIEVWEPNK